MEKDELEQHNIIDQYPRIAKQLKMKYDEWSQENIEPLWLDEHLYNCTEEEMTRQSYIDKAVEGERH